MTDIAINLASNAVWATMVELPKVGLLLPLENMKLWFACSSDLKVPGINFSSMGALIKSLRQTVSVRALWRASFAFALHDLALQSLVPRVTSVVTDLVTIIAGRGQNDSRQAKPLSGWQRFLASVTIGTTSFFVSSLIALPLQSAFVHLSTDILSTATYSSLPSFFLTMVREHGVSSLFRGWQVLLARSFVLSLLRFAIRSNIQPPRDPLMSGVFVFGILSGPDVVLVPFDALLQRVIIGPKTVSGWAWCSHLLTTKCPVRLYDSFSTVLVINAINALTTSLSAYAQTVLAPNARRVSSEDDMDERD
ncbi:hypothetical protein PTSG_05629 [Salpingoeca rosetta]|uniref:Uncharacterized protein n=1 Tax=Salpingoeca rosetta (strain ATCC 50818 / BSB-021) TaxID=946362 RepID=F2UBR8_SALR5|nr:uncharacterized protein PTSG_05629 [Salpingoeca rosetta]EGD73934.1 hypothetical protein PTSG_05629 [Salpingoeca rosetta]|eukprot:XP_004993497.1 hypothetical protein PTSG_05629 [Salpingoeca rosetta]